MGNGGVPVRGSPLGAGLWPLQLRRGNPVRATTKIKDRSNDRGELTPTYAATPVSTAEGAPAEEEAERKILYTVEELQAPRGLATGFS